MDWKIWSGGLAHLITQLVRIRFLSMEVHEVDSITGVNQQVSRGHEAAIGIRNQLGCMH
jgi:hypothetical protein